MSALLTAIMLLSGLTGLSMINVSAADEELDAEQIEDILSKYLTTVYETPEAKLYKALDNMEAVVSHNEAPISTWIPDEYWMNLSYGEENAQWSPWTRALREELKRDSIKKIEEIKKNER